MLVVELATGKNPTMSMSRAYIDTSAASPTPLDTGARALLAMATTSRMPLVLEGLASLLVETLSA